MIFSPEQNTTNSCCWATCCLKMCFWNACPVHWNTWKAKHPVDIRSVFLVDLHIDRKILLNATVYPGSAKAHSSVTHYGHNCCRWHAAFIMWPVGSASGFLYCCQSALWDMNALLSVSYNGTFNKGKNDFNIHLNFHKQTYIKNIHLKNVLWSSCNTDTDY